MKRVLTGWLALLSCFSVTSNNEDALPVQNRQETLRISGGDITEIEAVPYVVALCIAKGFTVKGIKEGQPYCTGSILDESWVLTAAHCILNSPLFTMVVAGCDKTKEILDDNVAQSRTPISIFKHPFYKENAVSKYDVALIKVEPFIFGPRVNKINVWATDWSKLPTVSGREYKVDTCLAVGWGSVELKISSDNLRSANMTIWHGTNACRCFQMFMQRRLLCSNAAELKGVCPGDSGGPLVCNGSVAGVAHMIYNKDSCKLSSFGKITLMCNSPKTVSTWMYVCPMLDFIKTHVPNLPPKPLSCCCSRIISFLALVCALPVATSMVLKV